MQQNQEIIYKPMCNQGIMPLKPETTILPAGSVQVEGCYPLPCNIRFDRDVEVVLPDGTKIYTDIYRPDTDKAVPAIVSWSPYGKHLHRLPLPWYVDNRYLSNLQKFEGPDPGFWCNAGYAVLQPDARGVFNSDGDMAQWGDREAQDVSDFIDWAGSQPWCTGKLGMAGSSWLSIIQWYTAAKKPKNLCAIAPWEGHYDGYRHSTFRGGIPTAYMSTVVFEKLIRGKNQHESLYDMVSRYPLCEGSYWQDKIAKVENIEIPAYVVASFTNVTHTHGTLDAWCELGSRDKWLRIHNTHEWIDLYTHQDDLQRFFDRYLKDEQNDWEQTPKVRMCILDPGGEDIVDRAETDFPLPQTKYQPLYLDASGNALNRSKPANESVIAYDSSARDPVSFSYTFEQDTEVAGYFMLKLWVSSESADDMDIFVHVQKTDEQGRALDPMVYGAAESGPKGMPYIGPVGGLRVSMRHIDPARGLEARPYLTYDRKQMLNQNEIVSVEIPLSPMGMRYHKGQQIKLTICGFPMDLPPEGVAINNTGKHMIHTGGLYDSHLLIPVS